MNNVTKTLTTATSSASKLSGRSMFSFLYFLFFSCGSVRFGQAVASTGVISSRDTFVLFERRWLPRSQIGIDNAGPRMERISVGCGCEYENHVALTSTSDLSPPRVGRTGEGGMPSGSESKLPKPRQPASYLLSLLLFSSPLLHRGNDQHAKDNALSRSGQLRTNNSTNGVYYFLSLT